MRAKLTQTIVIGIVAVLAGATMGCGEFVRGDRAPVTLRINQLVARAADGQTSQNTLRSDVRRNNGTVVDDMGEVTMSLLLKDPGIPGATNAPTAINTVTITRYRVSFRRSDGRNTPGVDVPFPFESALTVTVPADGTATAVFELIRHTSKVEAPLAGLAGGFVIISTIADVTFYGRDQAGNAVSATGSLGVLFGDFAG